MKNIGIVTWFKSRNYGTSLQAFALYKAICELRYNPYLIVKFEVSNTTFYRKVKNILGILGILPFLFNRHLRDIQGRKLLKFIKNDLRLKYIYSKSAYKKLLQTTDVFITGSDQIWNPFHMSPFYMLDFVHGKKKLAYASSIGVAEIPNEKKPHYKKYLSQFDRISLRESNGVTILTQLLERSDICQVLDPTFLLEAKDWILFGKTAELEFKLPAKYILTYLIGNNNDYNQAVKDITTKCGIQTVINIRAVENQTFSITDAINYKDGGPKEFIYLINNASLIVTDSFHAGALSINMSKNFVMLKRFRDNDYKSQNSRIYDLLGHFGLINRLYDNNTTIDDINYLPIQAQLSDERRKCLFYLNDSIEL